MKTFVMAAAAATITAGAVMAHPVNEPHICGIDPASLSEWPGYGTRGNIYDRGDYFFAVEVENFTPSIEYKHWNKVEGITNHIRIYKDDCRVSDIEIVHPESEPEVEAPAPVVIPEDSRTVHTHLKYWHEDFHNRQSDKYKTTLTVRTITDVTDGVTSELTRRVRTNENGRKFVTVDNHTTGTAAKWTIKTNGDIVNVRNTGYEQDRDVSESWLDSKPSRP